MCKQENYFITILPTGGAAPFGGVNTPYVGLGLLIPANIIKEQNARIFYCPSFDGDIYQSYNAMNNPYLPATNEVRTTYSTRPGELPAFTGNIHDLLTDSGVCWCSDDGGTAKPFQPRSWGAAPA